MPVPTWITMRIIDSQIAEEKRQEELNTLPNRVKKLEKRIAKLEKALIKENK